MEGRQGGSRGKGFVPSAQEWEEATKQFERESRVNKICNRCQNQFHTYIDFNRHMRNRKNILCTHCNKRFCTNHQIEKHLRTVSVGTQNPIDYEKFLHNKTGFEDDPRFEELVESKWEHICEQKENI